MQKLSDQGKDYATSDRVIQEDDIVTIDLSPQRNCIWGDYARTIIIEEGCSIMCAASVSNEEWKAGLQMEEKLHQELVNFVNETTTFEELYYHMNSRIEAEDFINLDFLGNLGHTIERDPDDRIYIEKGNKTRLSAVRYFTFEPHISRKGSDYGYKREDIYYYENGRLHVL